MRIFPALFLLIPSVCSAVTFRFCSIDVDFAPFARVNGAGHYQYLLTVAAQKAGITLDRWVAPRRRCLEEVRNGASDGMIAAYAPERAAYAVFPMSGATPDVTKTFGTVRYYVYRRKNSSLQWDGQHFNGLGQGVIGVESAFVFITDRLRADGVPYDDGGKTLEQNFSKLMAGRVNGVIAMDLEADKLLAGPYAGKIERIGQPFDLTPLYMMLSRQFYTRHPDAATRLWHAIESMRNSDTYRRYQTEHP